MFLLIVVAVGVLLYALNRKLAPVFVVHRSGAVLVSGASSGIGLDAVKALVQLGYTVFASYRSEADGKALKELGARPVKMDVVDESSMVSAIREVEQWTKETGQPFVALVNNAGISFSLPIELVPIEQARRLFDINFFGYFRLTQLALPLLRESKGRVLAVSSVAGLVVVPTHGTYGASKKAVEGLYDALRIEAQDFGVSVSLIEPAYVQTAIVGKSLADDSPFRGVPDAQRALYPKFFARFETQRRTSFASAPFPATTTTPAIVHAITNPQPNPRYIVSTFGKIPAWIVTAILDVLPTHLRDKAVRAATKY